MGWGLKTGASRAFTSAFFFLLFWGSTNLHLQLQLWKATTMEPASEPAPTAYEKMPKWCVSRRLGPMWVFFFNIRFFFYMLKGVYRYYLGYNDDIWPKRWALSKCFFKNYLLFFKTNYNCSEVFECTQTTVTPLFGPQYYTITHNCQHNHLNMATSPHQVTTPSHQQQAAGDDEGSRHTSSLWEKAQTMHLTSFEPWVSIFFYVFVFF